MIPNNNLSILPFYDSLEKQNHRKDYAYGEEYCLLTPINSILPFQVIVPYVGNPIVDTFLFNFTTGTYISIETLINAAGLSITHYESEDYSIIKFPGSSIFIIPIGKYYIHISRAGVNHYSEVFTVTDNISEALKIEYWDDIDLEFDLGKVDYSDGFKHTVYLPTQVGRPEYPIEEEVEKRDGHIFVEKQISYKVYKFDFIAPEYLCDAFRLIRMSDNIVITSKGEEYIVENFLYTPTWLQNGLFAKVEAEFQCNTVVKKLGHIYVSAVVSDFNIDYNNDY
jgi:hypothetical protein